MPLRKVAAGAMEEVATVEVATEVEGIFTAEAMVAGTLVVAGISAAGDISVAARLRGQVFAAIALSRSITQDRLPCGR